MKKISYILLILTVPISAYAQNKESEFEKKLIEHFQKYAEDGIVIKRDDLDAGAFKDFNVALSNDFIDFEAKRITLKNPYFAQKFEDSEKEEIRVRNFPKSFSVIYQNSLVSLFENGKFVCFKLDNLQRDTELENKLNQKTFKYHWIIDNQLAGLSGNLMFLWNGKSWIQSKNAFPLKNHPKLFEDDKFIIYRDCHGEWGGTVYFFEKATSHTFFTESTCANSVIKGKDGYTVLAQLGHSMGSTAAKTIPEPRKLTLANPNEIGKTTNGQALGYIDKSKAFEKKLDFNGVQIFSSFNYQDKVLYMVHLSDLTFIAEIKNNKIEIVNPLFFNDLYTHDPITQKYGKYTLMNLDFYGTGLDREIAVIIISGNKITKLDWNENHNQ